MRKKTLAAVLTIIVALASFAAYGAHVYWQRQIQHSFKVVGIDAELLIPSLDGLKNKVVATSLDGNNKVALSIYAENFYDIALNVTWTSNAEGLNVSATGQYFRWYIPQSTWTLEPQGSAFQIPLNTQYVVDKAKMMWSATGYAMIITFNFNTEGVLTPGDYTVDLAFQMGFVT
jgi:hypothetical protein